MFNITIMDEKGSSINVDVVRFFKKDNTNYLMYTMNEIDESGYVKIFAAKMQDATTFVKVEDEAEWATLKDLIKVIVREVKDGSLVSVEDLDVNTLKDVKVLASRAFKLTVAVKNSLGENKKVFEKVEQPAYTPFYEEETKEELVVETPVVTPAEQPVSSWLDTPSTPVYEEKPVTPVYAEESVYTLPKMEETPAYTPYYGEDEPTVDAPKPAVMPNLDEYMNNPNEVSKTEIDTMINKIDARLEEIAKEEETKEELPALEEAELPSIKTLDELLGITTFEEELKPTVEVPFESKEEPFFEEKPVIAEELSSDKQEEVTPMEEKEVSLNNEATTTISDLEKLVEELELKVKEYELRFEKIKDLLQ